MSTLAADTTNSNSELTVAFADALPDGVEPCTMGGQKGFRAKGDPATACHLHDGSDAGMKTALAKAVKDIAEPNHVLKSERDFAGTTDKPWDGSPARFADDEYQRSCLIDRGGSDPVKTRCSLPVLEPDGTINTNALAAAAAALAGARGGLKDVSAEQKASAQRKLRGLYAKTDKQPPDSLKLAEREYLDTVTLVGIDLLASGGPYKGSGSPPEGDYYDQAELRTIADANNELADEITPPVKVGHNRAQKLLKNSGLYTDEMPSAGWLTNFRVENGRLLADLRDVPRKLATLIPHGFRKRSVELSKVTSQTKGGRVYENVVTGLALLGAKNPAVRSLTDVRSLDDVLAWYADSDMATDTYAPGVEHETVMRIDVVEPDIDIRALAEEVAEQMSNEAGTSDTYGVAEDVKKPDLTDEQIESFAKEFGIEEDDPAKRRAAVLAKFGEFAVAEEPKEPPKPEAKPAEEPKPNENSDRAMSAADVEARVQRMFDDADRKRRAEGDVHAAILTHRIEPSEKDHWLRLYDADEDSARSALKARQPDTTRALTYGSDESGERGKKAAEDFDRLYEEYAAMTSVPIVTGGKT